MPIKKIKAQSPDPYVGKIVGDTEFARLAHLNHIVDQINASASAGISLTTLGSSGPATFISGVLNIPDYSGGTGGGVIQVENFDYLPGNSSNPSETPSENVLYITKNPLFCPTCGYPEDVTYYWNAAENRYYSTGPLVQLGNSYASGVTFFNFTNDFTGNAYSTTQGGVVNIAIENPRLDRAYRALVTRNTFSWPGYGFLYNWYAVADSRSILDLTGGTGLTIPYQWRVSTDADWNVLLTFIPTNPRIKLSSVLQTSVLPCDSQYGWDDTGIKGTDDYNFNALPAGIRSTDGNYYNSVGATTIFWNRSVSSDGDPALARRVNFYLFNSNVFIDNYNKGLGCSVRLVRAATAGELLLNDGDTSDTSSLDPYTGNDGTIYTTVKIDAQIWLAENLRETLYNNLDPITNLSSVGGDASNSAWQNENSISLGAYTIGRIQDNLAPGQPLIESKYLPEASVSKLFNEIRENTLQASPYWIETVDGINPVYQLELYNRKWKKTFINVKPTYDTTVYSDASSALTQRSLIVKSAETCADVLEFFPVNISTNTIEDLAGDGAVYLEILEYKGSASTVVVCPGEEGSGSSGGGGVGLSLLELQNQDFENLSQFLGLGVEQI
jgi:uncharacterized protein (TIGR02145 family)